MPLRKGTGQRTISNNLRELHGGNMYAKTKKKSGKKKANKQAVAVALKKAGKSKYPMPI